MRLISIVLGFLFFSNFSFSGELLPVEAFSQLPKGYNLKLSPDGKYIAYTRNLDGQTLLLTTNLKTGKSYGITKTNNEKYKISWFRWGNDDKIVYSMQYPSRRYGTGVHESRLMVGDKNGNDTSWLVRTKSRDPNDPQFQDNVISWLPNDPKHILVSVDFDRAGAASVYKVNLDTKKRKRIQSSAPFVQSWKADQQGRVRIGYAYKPKEGIAFTRILDIETDQWHILWERDALFDPPFSALGFGLDPHTLYLRADYEGRAAIYTIDTRHLDQKPTLKLSDQKYDMQSWLIYSPATNDVIGVYHDREENGRLYWDPRYEGLEAGLAKVFPGTDNRLTSFSRDEQRYILTVTNDTTPLTFYFGDRKKKSLNPILQSYPMLNPSILSPKNRLELTMRDGLEIEAFLTLPKEHANKKKLPTIIFPHGGPISRTGGGFDYWTQFFANRGYAVLQPNFRGSSGFGQEFKLQAIDNYGQGMQDDLIDSTQWLIDKGIADPQRICIVGGSYGGYAALTAAFKTPEMFQCAISFAGVSDLVAQRNEGKKFISRELSKKQYGRDDKRLEDNSAYYNVDKIQIPILLVHGDRDRVVLPRQSRKLAERLDSADKEFEYIELKNGSHFLQKQKNRTTLFKAMDKFLAKYLSPKKLAVTE
jgi:dipeptidyl aminopeptidase/acylaminoacyl peptidase